MSRGGDLYDRKWQKFLGRVWPFKFIPFVDFVLAAGSLATGNMHENSDFDVIVGVRQGRIFTARFFCWLIFGILGWRRKNHLRNYENIRKYENTDKICFNHFVTPKAYRLSPPHNEYWKNLYQKLVPVYGDPAIIQKFFDANTDWLGARRVYKGDKRHILLGSNIRTKWVFGDWLEKILKAIQIAKIKKNLKSKSGYKPRITYNDNELEFHPDTKRIENFLKEG